MLPEDPGSGEDAVTREGLRGGGRPQIGKGPGRGLLGILLEVGAGLVGENAIRGRSIRGRGRANRGSSSWGRASVGRDQGNVK